MLMLSNIERKWLVSIWPEIKRSNQSAYVSIAVGLVKLVYKIIFLMAYSNSRFKTQYIDFPYYMHMDKIRRFLQQVAGQVLCIYFVNLWFRVVYICFAFSLQPISERHTYVYTIRTLIGSCSRG